MSGVVTAAVVVGGASIYSANQAAKAGEGAADTAAQAEQNKLDYLMEQDAGANYYRDQGLDALGSYYGLGGYGGSGQGRDQRQYDEYMGDRGALVARIDELKGRGKHYWQEREQLAVLDSRIESLNFDPNAPQQQQGGSAQDGQAQLIEDVKSSPFYGSMIQEGEEAIGRNLSMTGGLRSGTANEALAQNSQSVLQNLVNQRLQGLSGMAQLPSNANNIGNSMSNVGGIDAQGQIASANSRQMGYQNAITGIGSAVGQYLGQPNTVPAPQLGVPAVTTEPYKSDIFSNRNAAQTYQF